MPLCAVDGVFVDGFMLRKKNGARVRCCLAFTKILPGSVHLTYKTRSDLCEKNFQGLTHSGFEFVFPYVFGHKKKAKRKGGGK
jgi:hypothetical protein